MHKVVFWSSPRWLAGKIYEVHSVFTKECRANADALSLKLEYLVIKNIVVKQAPKTRRGTYRAHDRINSYNLGSSCNF